MYKNIYYARLIGTENTLISKVFWDVTPCRLVYVKRSYEHTAVFRNVRNYTHLPVYTVELNLFQRPSENFNNSPKLNDKLCGFYVASCRLQPVFEAFIYRNKEKQ
jgi:hypothetical protein